MPGVHRGRADRSAPSPSRSAGRRRRWSRTGSRSSTVAGSSSRCRRRRPTSAPATTAWGRARADQPGRARGPRLESRRDRADDRRRGPQRAHRGPRQPVRPGASRRPFEAARGELPEGVGWRIEMRNEIPLARGLGSSAAASVAGRRGRPTPCSASRCRSPSSCGSPARSRGTRTTPRRRCSAGSWSPRRPRTASRPSGSTSRATCAPSCSSRSCASRPATCDDPADDRSARGRRREPRRGRRSASPGSRPAGPTCCGDDRGPAARAVSRRRPTRSCRGSSRPPATPGRSAPACPVPARRSSRSPTRWRRSPGSTRRSPPPPPTPTCRAGSSSSRRGMPVRGWCPGPDRGAVRGGPERSCGP